MPSKLHEAVVEFVLKKHGAKRGGFAAALRDLMRADLEWEGYDNEDRAEAVKERLEALKGEYIPIPDAWRIEKVPGTDLWRVEVWEVSLNTKEEHFRYIDLFWFLDAYEIALTVYRVDAHSRMEIPSEGYEIVSQHLDSRKAA